MARIVIGDLIKQAHDTRVTSKPENLRGIILPLMRVYFPNSSRW